MSAISPKDGPVAVTGCSGFTGGHMVRELVHHGYSVRACIRDANSWRGQDCIEYLSRLANVEIIDGCDLFTGGSYDDAFAGASAVFHVAAVLGNSADGKSQPLGAGDIAKDVYDGGLVGTQNVIDLANENSVGVLMTVSTDKAVSPSSIMGASKFIAEKLTIDGNKLGSTKHSCVRFGNVMGSRGSVIPTFIDGIKNRGSIWISDYNVTRFAMPISEAADLVLDATEECEGGEIFVLKMKAFSMEQLLRVFKMMPLSSNGFDIDVRGRVDAEKLHEELFTFEESSRLWETKSHYVISHKDAPLSLEGAKKSEATMLSSENAEMYSDSELFEIISTIAESILVD